MAQMLRQAQGSPRKSGSYQCQPQAGADAKIIENRPILSHFVPFQVLPSPASQLSSIEGKGTLAPVDTRAAHGVEVTGLLFPSW